MTMKKDYGYEEKDKEDYGYEDKKRYGRRQKRLWISEDKKDMKTKTTKIWI